MPWWMKHRLAQFGYMDEASGGEGDGGSGGGDGSGRGAADGGEGEAKKGEGEGKPAAGSKTTDAEAKLLREVMDKKDKLTKAESELRTIRATLAEFGDTDPKAVKALLAEKRAAEERQLEAKGEWETLKRQMNEATDAKLREKDSAIGERDTTISALQAEIADLTVGNAFGNSKWVAEELVTQRKARQLYGAHFEYDAGLKQVVGYDKPAGSKGRTMLVDGRGEPLEFEKAIEKIVDADPDGDDIRKSRAREGSGSRSDGHGGPNLKKPLSAADKIAAGLKGLNSKK